MTLSTAQLDTFFQNVDEGVAPDAATQLLLAAYAQQTIGGGLTDMQAELQALHIPPPADGSVGSTTPEDSTDVALAVYQFFTGSAPSLAGLDFLVNGGGNPNDLDSAYYAGFNQANRYYNFAINLITGNAAVAANFAATYGSASFDQVVTAAYESIVGTPNVGAAHAAAAIASIEAQLSYFQAVAAERAPNVNQDLATKAIAIAFILEEAIKADVGYYAFAIDQFDFALGQGGDNVPGETAGGVDLLTQFPIIPPGQTFTLTPGIDTITPPATNNNTVNGTELTFTAFDNINLGNTTGNVFNFTDTHVGGFDVVVPVDAQVSGVQTFNVNATEGVFVDTSNFVGLDTLNADIFASNGSTLTAGQFTNVNVTYTATDNSESVTVNGGAIITAQLDNPNNYYQAYFRVNGGPGTSEVDVTETGKSGDVSINDYYATIANVSLTGFNFSEIDINGDSIGLSNLTVSHSNYNDIFIDNSVSSPAALNLNVDHDFSLFIEDQGGYSTLNVSVAAGTAFSITSANGISRGINSFITPDMNGVITENVSGNGVLAQSSNNYYLESLESIIVSGAAGFVDIDTLASLAESQGNLTLFDASASSGLIDITLDGALTQFIGGSGVDYVSVDEDVTVSVAGGSSGANEIVLDFELDATAGATYADVTGFQILGTSFDSSGVYNLGGFAVPIANVEVIHNPAGPLTFTGAAVNQTLSVDATLGLGNSITLIQGAAAAASNHDVLNLNIGTAFTDGIDTSNNGSGFVNPVGTDVSVAEHAGATATSTMFFDTGVDLTTAAVHFTFTATPNGGTFTFHDNTFGTHPVETVTFTSSVTSTDLNFIASQINLNDPNVTASVSGSVLTVTSHIAGAAGNFDFTGSAAGAGAAETFTTTAGVDATADSGSIQVTAVDGVPNQLAVGDSENFIGNILLTGGESKLTVANDIAALLTGDGFTGVSVNAITDTVSFTYPDAGENSLGTSDTVAQVDTISLAGVTVHQGDVFSETFTGPFGGPQTVEYVALGGDTAVQVAAGLAAAINALTGTTSVVATASGSNLFLTEAAGDATDSFTSNRVSQETFNPFFVPVGSNAITANGYQTLNLDSRGTHHGGTNRVYVVDNALTNLNISGPEDLALATSGGMLLAHIDTTGATGFLNLFGVAQSEVTTGITANFGNASVEMIGNANAGFTDTITGGNGNDYFVGTGLADLNPLAQNAGEDGNTHISLGNGLDKVVFLSGTANVGSIGDHAGDQFYDLSNGNDIISVGNGAGDLVQLQGSGNSTVTVGNGAGDFVDDQGSGNNVIHVGSGAGDVVDLGSGMDTVTFGGGSGDKAEFNATGIGHVTFTGALAEADLSAVFGPSFAIATTTSQVSILANSLDTITGLVHGDHIDLPSVGDTFGGSVNNLAGVAGEVVFTTGTLSGGVFTYNAAGHDALLTYDNGAGNFVQVVLVGGAAEAPHAVLAGDVITF